MKPRFERISKICQFHDREALPASFNYEPLAFWDPHNLYIIHKFKQVFELQN